MSFTSGRGRTGRATRHKSGYLDTKTADIVLVHRGGELTIIKECLYCQSNLVRKQVSYTASRKGYHLIVHDVPAWVCEQCCVRFGVITIPYPGYHDDTDCVQK